MTRRSTAAPLVCLTLALVGGALFCARHGFDDDEFQHAHMAWLLHHGQRPFVDFFEHHLPTYHLATRSLFALGESRWTIFAFRALSWACFAGCLGLTFGAARGLARGRVGPCAGALLMASSPIWLAKMLEARPESPALLCASASLFLLLSSAPVSAPRVAFAGLLAGAMPALSLKFGLAAVGLVAAAFVLHGARRGSLAAAASTLPLLALLAWAEGVGVLGPMFRDAVVLNLAWKHRFSPTGYAVALWTESAVLVVAGAAGLLLLAGEGGRFRRAALSLTFLAAGAIVTLAVIPEPYRQAFLPLFPVLAIGAAVAVDRTLPLFVGRLGAAAACVLLAAAAAYPAAVSIAADLRTGPSADLARMRAAEATGSSHFFDGRGLMFYRAHTGRYGCMHQGIQAMLDPETFAAETVAALRDASYPTVIMDYRVEQMPSAIGAAIRDRYQPVGDGIRVPAFRVDRARLAGREHTVQVPAAGVYRLTWRGGELLCNGTPVLPGADVRLPAGPCRLQGMGFIEGFTAVLVRRDDVEVEP